ncbi:hypothetical protein SAMN05421812_10437 [Asanoa hainanensis]|uniref:Uncharacterized protein n=1 Tax=Asanoa hainanensis TaxID=560556 RepID=A0A239L476_9ACTN|nr:hypothetical protein [Asanoa hainanensis]SNT25407.1 hypothetical protein SAMN05421812_10437 [Asanoa hainanensis]
MRRTIAAAVAGLLLLAGCANDSAPSDEDLSYGAAPKPDGVTLQPDVVIVGGGGRSVRSVTADGLSWRIDADAPHADDLAPGKVMFVTERGVGRVLDIAPAGDDLLVTVGPVDITEVVRDGTFERADVALEDPVVYPAGEPFWADERPKPPSTYGRSVPVQRRTDQPTQPGRQRGGEVTTRALGYTVYPTCCTNGAGVHFSYDDGGVRLVGTVTLTSKAPRAAFHLAIGGGTVTRAELEISGGFGLKAEFEAGIKDGKNHKKVFPIAADLSFPIGSLAGIPLSFTVSQTLGVTTAFGAKVGTVKGSGEFSLAGSLGFGYANGTFGPHVKHDFQRRSSLLNSLTGVPVGVMGLVIAHGVRFTVGIGAFLFKAGVYFELITRYGSTLGSALGAPYAQCRGVAIGVDAAFGVGYTILDPVVKVINSFLSLLKPFKVVDIPPIKNSGGIRSTSEVYTNEEVIPDVAVCGHVPA